jgi:hypothetical protein
VRCYKVSAKDQGLTYPAAPSGGFQMNDDRILRVLEEMRDLQRQNVTNYQEALRNQQESIRLQQAGLKRARIALGLATIVLVLAVGMLIMLLLRAVARLP